MNRITILYSRLTGYTAACQRALKALYGVELQVFHWTSPGETPFGDSILSHIDQLCDKTHFTTSEMLAAVDEFDPDALLVSGWVDSGYLHVGRSMRKRGVPVIAGTDGQWRGTLRQHLARLASPIYLQRAIDVLWVTGERQRELARRLGYRGTHCWDGYYACDWKLFAAPNSRSFPRPTPHFLYVGRYVPAKGLDILVEAYQRYRPLVSDPWPLHCVGTGDLKSLLEGQDGITDLGFILPKDLPRHMFGAAAFVLPSRWEPWGVVIQEAAAAGLPLVCSDACGAAVHLLRDGHNGFLFESERADELTRSFLSMHNVRQDEWEKMSVHSYELSKQYTPGRWASTLFNGVEGLRSAN